MSTALLSRNDGLKRLAVATPAQPLRLDSGRTLENVEIAYETWGELSPARDNVVIVCHALTGDQFAGSPNPITSRPAWWPLIVGPGLPVDTNRFYVICTNILGGCMGSTGPASAKPDGSGVWGTDFPLITIADMVRAQIALLDALGIEQVFLAIGGSIGGMQVLEWTIQARNRVFAAVPIAVAPRQSAQNIGFYETGRQAIMADPNWKNGAYVAAGTRPDRGLAVARMAAHITYVSESALKRKFDRRLQDREAKGFGFDADFQIESYLRHQGQTFVDRFDANSYLYITRAMDYFDIAADHGGVLANAFRGLDTRFCVFSFSSDWHYTPEENRDVVRALNAAGCETSYVSIDTDKGHDAFFVEEPEFEAAMTGFIDAAADARGLKKRGRVMKSGPGANQIRRADHVAIAQFINPGDLVLDVGCGDGQLMELLQQERKARTRGLEVEQSGVNRCVSKGLAVVQGDADHDLPVYPDDAYDAAILSKTIQEMARPKAVMEELARVARRVIVSFRNYGHWHVRLALVTTGRIPSLGHNTGWWTDGARRPCSARDMAELAKEVGLKVVAIAPVGGQPAAASALTRLNWTAEELVFVLERAG